MKKIISFLFVLTLSLYSHSGMFQSVDDKDALILQTGKNKDRCPACNMSIPQYYKTSHAVKFADGSHRQYCSIFCVIDEMKHGYLKERQKDIVEILAVNAKTLKIINAKKAYYVIGSSKPPTMSMTSSYAFESKNEAEEFKKQNGGKIVNYEAVYQIISKEFGH
jgi:nitrous oxide reductase accessory protein NosL